MGVVFWCPTKFVSHSGPLETALSGVKATGRSKQPTFNYSTTCEYDLHSSCFTFLLHISTFRPHIPFSGLAKMGYVRLDNQRPALTMFRENDSRKQKEM